jgi:hypothetical protein
MITDFGKSRELGFATVWSVDAQYEIVDGFIRPKPAPSGLNTKFYAPLSHPILPRLARLEFNDEAAVLSFVTQYGLLGYDQLVDVDSRLGGDDLKWVWAHSQTIRLSLDILNNLQAHDEEKLFTLLTKLPQANDGTLSPIVRHAAGGKVRAKPWVMGDKPEKNVSPTVALGWKILSDLINANMRGICPRLSTITPQPRIFWKFGALIEVAYWQLANLTTGRTGRVARCEAIGCGARFIQTDGRQRFCPPDVPKGESRCAVRQRARNNRNSQLAITGEDASSPSRRKGGGKDGKKAR